MGALMGLMGLGVLVVDHALAPWYPILGVTILILGCLGTHELRQLLPAVHRPFAILIFPMVVAQLASHWLIPILPPTLDILDLQLSLFTVFVMATFIMEIGRYSTTGIATPRIALTLLTLSYIGLLGGCLARLRWLEVSTASIAGQAFSFGTLALAFAFFVPKAGDIGAYFAGHAFGRNKFAPIVSPKKTWEGAIGGFIGSVAMAVALAQLTPLFAGRLLTAIAFGATLGIASQLGDLSESILKRDGQTKDASRTIPGFGGVLDVIDSILFAAPVTLVWLSMMGKLVNSWK